MKQITDEIYNLTTNIDIHYDPQKGRWYLQDYHTDKASKQNYDTVYDAERAFYTDEIIWI